MRKLMLLAIFAIAFTFKGTSQDVRNVVKLNPLGLIFGTANIGYERALGEKNSILIAPAFGMLKSNDFKYSTYGLGFEYRFYFGKDKQAPAGFYAAPGVAYNMGEAKSDESKTSVSGYSIKGIFGHQWIWNSGFALELNGGIQYVDFNFKNSELGTPLSGFLPTLGFSFGYAF